MAFNLLFACFTIQLFQITVIPGVCELSCTLLLLITCFKYAKCGFQVTRLTVTLISFTVFFELG